MSLSSSNILSCMYNSHGILLCLVEILNYSVYKNKTICHFNVWINIGINESSILVSSHGYVPFQVFTGSSLNNPFEDFVYIQVHWSVNFSVIFALQNSKYHPLISFLSHFLASHDYLKYYQCSLQSHYNSSQWVGKIVSVVGDWIH